MVTLVPQKHQFMWKSHGLNPMENLNANLEIRYTLDGSKPNTGSELYSGPFLVKSGEVHAMAFDGDEMGGENSTKFGILKNDWKLIEASSKEGNNIGAKTFDDDVTTYWKTKEKNKHPHHISIDLGSEFFLSGFAYTPITSGKEGMIEKGTVLKSTNGRKWQEFETFEFGNLINDPTKRSWSFQTPVKTRYIRIRSDAGAGGSKSAIIAELDFYEK